MMNFLELLKRPEVMRTPTGQRIQDELAELDGATPADRAVKASRFAELEAPPEGQERAIEARDAAAKRVAAAAEELAAAKREFNGHEAQLRSLSWARTRERSELQRELRRTAPECVDELREWAHAELAALRKSRPVYEHDNTRRIFGYSHGPVVRSDVASRERRHDYLVSVTREAEDSPESQAARIADPEKCAAFCERVKAELPPLEMEKFP